MIRIELRGLCKSFLKGNSIIEAIKDVTLDVKVGEILVFVGPSGCGKSTILNLITGTMEPSAGHVHYNGKLVTGVQTVARRVGYLTQKDTVLPWRTVLEDIMLPLEIQNIPHEERVERAMQAVEMVRLKGFEHHYPKELSGGMRKRVLLARTLVYQPETLLMDEPFGSLDAQTKLFMQNELLQLWRKTKDVSIVFVTHDLGEAVALADRMVLFTGRPGTPKIVHEVDIPRPRDVFKIRFAKLYAETYNYLWNLLEEEVAKGEEL